MPKLVEWLDSLTDIDDATRKALKASIGAVPADKQSLIDKAFEAGVLRQQDYSRNMNDLKKQQEQLQADFEKKDQDVERYKKTLIDTRGRIDGSFRQAVQERDAMRQQLIDTNTKIRKLAEQEGFSVEELGLRDVPAAPAGGGGTAGSGQGAGAASDADPNAPTYITEDRLIRETTLVPLFQAQIEDAVAEYEDLYGKKIGRGERERIATEAIKQGKQPKDIAAGMYDFQTKRDERAASERQVREDQIRAETRQQVMSEVMAGNGTSSQNGAHGANSPALRFSEKHNEAQRGQDISHLLHAAQSMEEEARKMA